MQTKLGKLLKVNRLNNSNDKKRLDMSENKRRILAMFNDEDIIDTEFGEFIRVEVYPINEYGYINARVIDIFSLQSAEELLTWANTHAFKNN